MKRLATVMAAAAVMAVVTGAYGAQLALAGTCTGKVPTKLGWTRQRGARRRRAALDSTCLAP